jgi:hypothetical protein
MCRTTTVLVTGASGVVGTALLRRLRDLDVVCLMHRSPVTAPHMSCVRGDIRVQRFVIERGRGSALDRAGLAIELESAAAALEHVATTAANTNDNDALLARALFVRYATEPPVRAARQVGIPDTSSGDRTVAYGSASGLRPFGCRRGGVSRSQRKRPRSADACQLGEGD